jgi:hypothetical protein
MRLSESRHKVFARLACRMLRLFWVIPVRVPALSGVEFRSATRGTRVFHDENGGCWHLWMGPGGGVPRLGRLTARCHRLVLRAIVTTGLRRQS